MAKRVRDEGTGKRTEIVTVRFDPKLKYLAELAARKHRRPLSSFIEWAVEKTLSQIALGQGDFGQDLSVTDAEAQYRLWDPDEPDRIARLALKYPELMTFEEQVVWKLVRENGYVWKGRFAGDPPEWTWQVNKESIRWARLRERWTLFRDVAAGTKPPTDLPTWPKSPPAKSQNLADDDEIPS